MKRHMISYFTYLQLRKSRKLFFYIFSRAGLPNTKLSSLPYHIVSKQKDVLKQWDIKTCVEYITHVNTDK